MADTKQKLDNDVFSAASIAQKYNCMLTRLDYRQEQGLMSSIPLGENLIQIQRGLTTSSTAIFVPFTVQELFQSGEALYYGLNALSNNMILCDRKRLKNPNGLILGTPGSGKSFSAKREITNAFLITADDIIICDPEAEYYPLVERLKGQVIKVSQNSTQYINPMDINLNYSEGDTPIALKSDFILSFCELIMGGNFYKDGQLEKQQPEATPESLMTGETVRTPRGNFHITDMTREQIEAAGFGFHHASEDGKYLIMGNGTQAFAIAAEQPQRDNPLKHVEDTIEQNDNNFDGLINNMPQTPTVADFEQRAKAGETISVTDLAKAVKAEKREQPQKKPSILKKLDEYKKQAAQQPKDKQKEHKKDLEV